MFKKLKIPLIASCTLIIITILMFGCKKEKSSPGIFHRSTPQEVAQRKIRQNITQRPEELDFFVKNKTGQPLFITCFYYAKKSTSLRWRWYKTPVYNIQHNEKALIDIITLPDGKDKMDVHGYLGVFDDQVDADTSIYELLRDENKIPLGKLYNIRGSTLILEKDDYGFKGQQLDYYYKPKDEKKAPSVPELDFVVENKTSRNMWVTCFVYEKPTDIHDEWEFKKTPVQKLDKGSSVLIDVDTITNLYDRKNVRGNLAVFDEDQKNLADEATYELTPVKQVLKLGPLYRLRGKKIVLDSNVYGLQIDQDNLPEERFIEYLVEDEKTGQVVTSPQYVSPILEETGKHPITTQEEFEE